MSDDAADRPPPPAVPALFDKAETLRRRGQSPQARYFYLMVLDQAPDHVGALRGLASVEFGARNVEAAAALLARAVERDPGSAAAHLHLGIALHELNRPGEALASFDRALAIEPALAAALGNRGNVLRGLKDPEAALVTYDRLLALLPDSADTLNNRGIALQELNRRDEALASYDRALALQPLHAQALNNRGTVLAELGRPGEALGSYGRALAVRPGFADALNNRGTMLTDLGRHAEASSDFERLLSVDPGYPYAAGQLMNARIHASAWDGYDAMLERLAAGIDAGRRAVTPLVFLSLSPSPARQLRCARIFAADRYRPAAAGLWNGEVYDHSRIRVAYLSADFSGHIVASLIADLIERHDASLFEITALSFGTAASDGFRARIAAASGRFVDVRDRSDRQVAALLRSLEIDIAVDLNGYTRHGRTGILAFRPAPIQVNYLGYPGSSGTGYIDYIIADRVVIPPEAASFYSEAVIHLPDTYLPCDSTRREAGRTPSRAEAGLPADGFVFCCFNKHFKITPPVFDVWMRLLRRIEGSVLWLPAGAGASAENLRLAAASRAVAPERLVFAPPAPLEDHLARHRLADLFLDTSPFNAHSTAGDALWAGLPVVTWLGRSFAGRVAASLLRAAGLPELVAADLAAYEALAGALAADPARLAALRARLAASRETAAIFDMDRLCRHIESAYVAMWRRARAGEPPAGFAVT